MYVPYRPERTTMDILQCLTLPSLVVWVKKLYSNLLIMSSTREQTCSAAKQTKHTWKTRDGHWNICIEKPHFVTSIVLFSFYLRFYQIVYLLGPLASLFFHCYCPMNHENVNGLFLLIILFQTISYIQIRTRAGVAQNNIENINYVCSFREGSVNAFGRSIQNFDYSYSKVQTKWEGVSKTRKIVNVICGRPPNWKHKRSDPIFDYFFALM